MKVLHLTPHLGGGVFRVLLNYFSWAKENSGHEMHLACLDYANEKAKAVAKEEGFYLLDLLAHNNKKLINEINWADLVVVHWWNHPLLYNWLINEAKPKTRLMFWAHVSGKNVPQIFTKKLLNWPDIFAFSTPLSFKLSQVVENNSEKFRLIFSTGGFKQVEKAGPISHPGFNLAYLGTVDYIKMHPKFIELSLNSQIPEATFWVAGGPYHENLKKEIEQLSLSHRFKILGPINDVKSFLAPMDIFNYPLNPNHYGTGEQVLIEAMAMGVPPVVLGGGAEEFTVSHLESGLVAQNLEDFSKCLNLLWQKPKLRLKLSRGGQKRVYDKFTIEKTGQAFENAYQDLISHEPRPFLWNEKKLSPLELFLESLGENWAKKFLALPSSPFTPPSPAAVSFIKSLDLEFFSETRGSIFHYAHFFKDDKLLNYWCQLFKTYKPTF